MIASTSTAERCSRRIPSHALASVIADPVHAYLAAAFSARIEQAVAGQPPETPLPDPLA